MDARLPDRDHGPILLLFKNSYKMTHKIVVFHPRQIGLFVFDRHGHDGNVMTGGIHKKSVFKWKDFWITSGGAFWKCNNRVAPFKIIESQTARPSATGGQIAIHKNGFAKSRPPSQKGPTRNFFLGQKGCRKKGENDQNIDV